MKFNTRFNPTVNGPLHIGHLYTILVNWTEAKLSGGKFYLRFDDTQIGWNRQLGKIQVEQYKQLIKDDLAWLGIDAEYISQAEIMGEVDDLLHGIFRYTPEPEHYFCEVGAELAGCQHHFYPYTDRLTCEKVIMDAMIEINCLIRGMDLITEDCLYHHFCHKFGIRSPTTTYIPRLSFDGSHVISKTAGGYKIHQYREAGMKANQLIFNLADDCLIDFRDGWTFKNIKREPTLSEWAEVINVPGR